MKTIYLPYYIGSSDYRTDRGKLRSDLYHYTAKGVEIASEKISEDHQPVQIVWVEIREWEASYYSWKIIPSDLLDTRTGYVNLSTLPSFPEIEERIRKQLEAREEIEREGARVAEVIDKVLPGQFTRTTIGFSVEFEGEEIGISPNLYGWITEKNLIKVLRGISENNRKIRERNLARKEQEKKEREEKQRRLRAIGPRASVNGVIYTPDEKGVINVPKWALGLLIGSGGSSIKAAEAKYGQKIKLNGVEMECPRKVYAEWILK